MNIKSALKLGHQTALMHRMGAGWVVTKYHNWDWRMGHASAPMPYGKACQMVRAHRIQWSLIALANKPARADYAPYGELANAWAKVPGTWQNVVRAAADRLGLDSKGDA
jgi:hypothetical protein